jgi:hypothetical protein
LSYIISIYVLSQIKVATVCCSVVNAAEEKLPLAAVANRQSRQMFFMPPPPLFHYYNPYGSQILLPTEQDQIDPGQFSGIINRNTQIS